jgi:hypothetical protein
MSQELEAVVDQQNNRNEREQRTLLTNEQLARLAHHNRWHG